MSKKDWTPEDYPEMFDKLPDERKKLLLDWIDTNLYPIQGFNTNHTSYGLKHRIKFPEGIDHYFYNGEFKGAMLKCGFKVKDKDALNWVFNISQKSPGLKNPACG